MVEVVAYDELNRQQLAVLIKAPLWQAAAGGEPWVLNRTPVAPPWRRPRLPRERRCWVDSAGWGRLRSESEGHPAFVGDLKLDGSGI